MRVGHSPLYIYIMNSCYYLLPTLHPRRLGRRDYSPTVYVFQLLIGVPLSLSLYWSIPLHTLRDTVWLMFLVCVAATTAEAFSWHWIRATETEATQHHAQHLAQHLLPGPLVSVHIPTQYTEKSGLATQGHYTLITDDSLTANTFSAIWKTVERPH